MLLLSLKNLMHHFKPVNLINSNNRLVAELTCFPCFIEDKTIGPSKAVSIVEVLSKRYIKYVLRGVNCSGNRYYNRKPGVTVRIKQREFFIVAP